MISERIIEAAEFSERLSAICVGGAGSAFPRKFRDRQILYRAILHSLEVRKKYSEGDMNEVLQKWLLDIGACLDIDHVTLRRYLIDERYLVRDANGSTYEVNPSGRDAIEFDPSVEAIDPIAVLQTAKDRAAERKRNHAPSSA